MELPMTVYQTDMEGIRLCASQFACSDSSVLSAQTAAPEAASHQGHVIRQRLLISH